jgi:ubiquinone/menaquinone biosynthesis C-methylase UbiE
MSAGRTADYDSIAARYDRRYGLHEYAGVRDYLSHFVSTPSPAARVLEVGCGTGHWIEALGRAGVSGPRALVAGLEPSARR